MNLRQINEIRASIGLAPLPVNRAALESKRQNEKNRAARGDASRELKAKRASRSK